MTPRVGARRYTSLRWLVFGCVAGTLTLAACGKLDSGTAAFESGNARPDVLPAILNKDLPFRYPPALYAEKVQGNVMLRLYVDKEGSVVTDSTRVVETSTVPMLDSAAVRGAKELRFVPAKLRGTAMAVSILFPVYFRHPEVPPPPSDSILRKTPMPVQSNAPAAKDSVARDTAKKASKSKS